MAFPFAHFKPQRIRPWINRLPLCTRVVTFIFACAWIGTSIQPWLKSWASLTPSEVNLKSMHRINTYPFVHRNLLHVFCNTIALVPLLERFEAEFGTLVTFALLSGPFATLPAILYIVFERFILRSDTAVLGASVWVFLLLAAEALKAYKVSPFFSIGPYKIPTWVTPLFFIALIAILVPNTSLIGHSCGTLIGYVWGLGYIKFLVPHEKILRYIEGKLNLLGRLPHYVSVDQKTYGRYGVLPSNSSGRTVSGGGASLGPVAE